MRTILHLLIGLALAMAVPASADTLAQLHKSFMERYDAANQSRDDQLKKLDASYLAALERQVEKNKATGKLDAVIPFFDEVQDVKTAKDPLPELPATAPAELKQMRAKHAEARDKILKSHAQAVSSLATKMETALKTQEAELTKAGKIDEALAAKHMRESLTSDKEVFSARKSLEGETVDGGWQSLRKAGMNVTTQSQIPVQWMNEEIAARLPETIAKTVSEVVVDSDSVLQMVPKASVRFSFAKPVSSFKCDVFLGSPEGDATVNIIVGGEKIKSSELNKDSNRRTLIIRFDPTKELMIEVDEKGHQHGDWVYLIDPVSR